MSKRADGSYACSIGGIVISIPRQVGKTFLIGAMVFALCLLNPGLTVIWTSHHTATANETFDSMQGFARRRKIAPMVLKVLIDDMTIKFTNGSRVLFGARERGFGRGFTNVGVLVFDEAQILSERAIDDMVPSTNTATNPLLLMMGTPPKPTDNSEVFTNRRNEALSGDAEDMGYIEFSAAEDCDPMDRKQWAQANPSYPTRTNAAAVLRMNKNLTPESFMREALGVWDQFLSAEPLLIDADKWLALGTPTPPDGDTVFGVKFSPDGRTVALSGAVRPEVGPVYVEGIGHRLVGEGTGWLVDFLVARRKPVAIDGRSGAGALEEALVAAGFPARRITRPTTDEAIAAHAGFVGAIASASIAHPNDPALTAAATSVIRRPIGRAGGWGFSGRDGADVTLVESAVLASWLAPAKKSTGRRTGGRVAILPS
ncbi:MAG: DEAD/DEAH box helicase family protein [Aquihabitans sp.]